MWQVRPSIMDEHQGQFYVWNPDRRAGTQQFQYFDLGGAITVCDTWNARDYPMDFQPCSINSSTL